jgi:hypothetical protein
MKILNQISFIIMLLLIWFRTNAFREYMSLLNIKKITKIINFEEYKKTNPSIDYLSFIKIKYPNFFTQLITCPYCIGFWISVCSCLLFNDILYLPFYYVFSIIPYRVMENYL